MQLIKFSDQSNRKRPIFGRFGSRNKFNSHRGRLRSLPKESILVAAPARSKRWIWRTAFMYILNGFVFYRKYTARGLKRTGQTCEVCVSRPRVLYFPVVRQSLLARVLLPDSFYPYHVVKRILLLSGRLSLL